MSKETFSNTKYSIEFISTCMLPKTATISRKAAWKTVYIPLFLPVLLKPVHRLNKNRITPDGGI